MSIIIQHSFLYCGISGKLCVLFSYAIHIFLHVLVLVLPFLFIHSTFSTMCRTMISKMNFIMYLYRKLFINFFLFLLLHPPPTQHGDTQASISIIRNLICLQIKIKTKKVFGKHLKKKEMYVVMLFVQSV